jgi:hypothetical protein
MAASLAWSLPSTASGSAAPSAPSRSGAQRFHRQPVALVNLTDRRVAVDWRAANLDPARFIDRPSELGYRAYPYDSGRSASIEEQRIRNALRYLQVAFAAMNITLLSVAVWSGNANDGPVA